MISLLGLLIFVLLFLPRHIVIVMTTITNMMLIIRIC